MDSCRLRGGIIIRSPFYIMGGGGGGVVFLTSLQRKADQTKWVVLFNVLWVSRCTGDPLVALKHGKSQICMICHL